MFNILRVAFIIKIFVNLESLAYFLAWVQNFTLTYHTLRLLVKNSLFYPALLRILGVENYKLFYIRNLFLHILNYVFL